MKRFLSMLLVISLVLFSATALAEFDSSVFAGVDNVFVSIDDMEGVGYIDLTSKEPCFFDPNYSKYKYCAFYPSVRIDEKGTGVLRMFGSFYGEDWAFFDSMIIKIGNNRYTFSEIYNDRNVVEHAEVNEELAIVMDSTTEVFVRDFIENADGEIKVRWCGDKYNVDFTMTDTMKSSFKTFFEKYIEAGGYDSSNIDNVLNNSYMTVK